MSNSFLGDGFPGRGGNAGSPGWPMNNILEAVEQLRGQFEQKVGGGAGGGSTRVNRGDVRTSVLALLAEKPMHGYQIIREIEERSGGSWKPSPGSVYPTLQLLTDEGLVSATESDGRKTYSLTDEGRAVAGAESDRSAPWTQTGGRDGGRTGGLPKAGIDLAQAVAQVSRSGNPEQVKKAVDVLDEARRKIFSILAQD
ncbi:PadR family transcriptional regulator [Microbacterium sp. 1P10UB]|uniref:PadR family transcriptional regulator n=1 Tax=unclassified Microbacterium TaxID=2609290 RepID=UPI0039A0CBDB